MLSSVTSTGSLPTTCVASVKKRAPLSWQRAPISRIGLSVPTSLLPHMTVTRIVSSRIASRIASALTRPFSSGAT